MASPYIEVVFLGVEGVFLYAWAGYSELRLNSDEIYFKSESQFLNLKACCNEFSQYGLLESISIMSLNYYNHGP